jgi:CheY-like chemotaxis protein
MLDIGMPELDGYEVARWVRSRPIGKGITLIAITGWGQAADKARAVDAGFDHHLTKPVEPDALTELLRSDAL